MRIDNNLLMYKMAEFLVNFFSLYTNYYKTQLPSFPDDVRQQLANKTFPTEVRFLIPLLREELARPPFSYGCNLQYKLEHLFRRSLIQLGNQMYFCIRR